MDDNPYMTKEIRKDYKSKDYSVATSPDGNQYSLGKGQAEQLLRLRGFKNATEARKEGWTFDGK